MWDTASSLKISFSSVADWYRVAYCDNTASGSSLVLFSPSLAFAVGVAGLLRRPRDGDLADLDLVVAFLRSACNVVGMLT